MKRITVITLILLCAAPLVRSADLSGHKLLVTSVRTGDTEVFIADPMTGDLFNVSRAPKSEDRYPCWSPDGKQICFMSDREGTTNLWVCNADGSKARRLNRTPDVCYMPSWQKTPRGERIVFGKHGDKPGMASIKPDGSDEQALGESLLPCVAVGGAGAVLVLSQREAIRAADRAILQTCLRLLELPWGLIVHVGKQELQVQWVKAGGRTA